MVHSAEVQPGFHSIRQQGVIGTPGPPGWDASLSQGDLVHILWSDYIVVLLLPPPPPPPAEWDVRPSQGYPQHFAAGTYLYTWVERDKME